VPLPPTIDELRRQFLTAAIVLGAAIIGAGVVHLLGMM
jgi:hypothetical protein